MVSNGRTSKHVTMYEANGLDFTPVALWLDDSGELFMSGGGWGRRYLGGGWNTVLSHSCLMFRTSALRS